MRAAIQNQCSSLNRVLNAVRSHSFKNEDLQCLSVVELLCDDIPFYQIEHDVHQRDRTDWKQVDEKLFDALQRSSIWNDDV